MGGRRQRLIRFSFEEKDDADQDEDGNGDARWARRRRCCWEAAVQDSVRAHSGRSPLLLLPLLLLLLPLHHLALVLLLILLLLLFPSFSSSSSSSSGRSWGRSTRVPPRISGVSETSGAGGGGGRGGAESAPLPQLPHHLLQPHPTTLPGRPHISCQPCLGYHEQYCRSSLRGMKGFLITHSTETSQGRVLRDFY